MVHEQKDFNEEVKKESKAKPKEPPIHPAETSESQEGRKLYATKFGAKYHFDRNCKTQTSRRSHVQNAKQGQQAFWTYQKELEVLAQHKKQKKGRMNLDLKWTECIIMTKNAQFTETR